MDIPQATIDWLIDEENPAVSVLAQELLLGRSRRSKALGSLWARRNEYGPVATILDAMREDGSWTGDGSRSANGRDYLKYTGNLWQIVFLGEMWADSNDPRLTKAIEYAFGRQLPSGAWGWRPIPSAAGPCLTANVGRGLARMGLEGDERVIRALDYLVDNYRELGVLGCRDIDIMTLNGYCHMLAPKVLLFLGEVPKDAWPRGAVKLRDECVRVLRDKHVLNYLPQEYRRFTEEVWPVPKADRPAARERFMKENAPIAYREKSGWTRFGFPLHYNSDALEALLSLAAVGETMRKEYADALELVRGAADGQGRWLMKNSLNGKMIANVEEKGQASKWVTLRALSALAAFGDRIAVDEAA